MITKLTAENAELYYAPRFAEITAAFKASDDENLKGIEIHSLEDYFLYLDKIAALQVGAKDMPNAYLLVLPADEEIFAINANTRAISVPAFVKKNGIGVYGDHYAEMIVMTIDRYFDHEDFLNDEIVINWNFTPAGSRTPGETHAVAAFAPNEELNPGYITFGFIITKEMTPEKGTLTFSVTIYDTKSGEIAYSFNTLTASVNINDTLTLLDPTIIVDDTSNYVNRLSPSVYTDNTIPPIGLPEWKSGLLINHQYTGLDDVAYFDGEEDKNNEYINGAMLTAYASVDPATADLIYKWTYSPVDGTVETVRNFETVNKFADYVEVDLPQSDNGAYFYKLDEMNKPVTTEPLTYTQAKELYDEAADASDTRSYLNLQIKRLVTAPNDENVEDSQFNQDHITFAVQKDRAIIYSTEELRTFASTNPEQGSGKWVGIDIDTGLESIVGLNWNNKAVLDENDVAEAASVGLGPGHIIFWVKADSIVDYSKTIVIGGDATYKPTQIVFKYAGVNTEVAMAEAPQRIFNSPNVPKFCVRGTSYHALYAGNYQVTVQARVSAGENYEKVLDGADLKVNTQYFLKDQNGEIDKLHPLVNEDAIEAQAAEKELYVLVSAARNSIPVESSVLSIPPAKKPVTHLSVESVYQFNDEVKMEEGYAGPEYIYISDNGQPPVIVATVTIDSDDARDSAGVFAAELVETSEDLPTFEEIEQKIADHELDFRPLGDGKFPFMPTQGEIKEGEYVARTINRRNRTYSISDNSESIHTSFVAPAINQIDVFAVFDDEDDIVALENGVRPQSGIVNFEINRNRSSYNFEMVDNSRNFKDAVCAYYIEEVEYDEETGIVRARTPEDKANDPFEYGEFDINPIEPVQDENDETVYRFTIERDPGYYRIKTENKYNGTVHTSYTDIFGIVAH